VEEHARTWRPFGRAMVIALTLFACGVLVAACGGGSAAPGVASIGSAPSTTIAGSAASLGGLGNIQALYQTQLAFAECMPIHGVPSYPDPKLRAHAVSFSGMNSKTPQFASASTACKRLVPDGGPPSDAQKQASLAALLNYAKCMRAQGQANFPDPDVSNGRIQIALRGLDPSSPQYQSAAKTCGTFAPGAPG
jgi:hypothetical protein